MKKWIISSCMGAVLALSIGAVAMASNGIPKELCEELGLPTDTCANCLNSGSGDKAVCLCKSMDNLGFENQGQCVQYLFDEYGVP